MPDSAKLIFDDACHFCTRWSVRLSRWAGDAVEAIPSGPESYPLHPELNPQICRRSVQLILPGGRRVEGAEAACTALSLRRGFSFIIFIYRLPLIRQACDLAYRIIAKNRERCEECGDY